MIPWNEKTAPNRVRPRECVACARDALDAAYNIPERAAIPLLIEAVDWLRRALEQMVGEQAQGEKPHQWLCDLTHPGEDCPGEQAQGEREGFEETLLRSSNAVGHPKNNWTGWEQAQGETP